jgi:hypothetical protein
VSYLRFEHQKISCKARFKFKFILHQTLPGDCKTAIRVYKITDNKTVIYMIRENFQELYINKTILFFDKIWARFYWGIRRHSLRFLITGFFARQYYVAVDEIGKVNGFVSIKYKGAYFENTWGIRLHCVKKRSK